MSLENVITAIRSDLVICVLTNFSAAACARTWSAIGMDVISKNMTMRRRSLYLMSPGFSGAIWLAVTALGAGVAGFSVAGPRFSRAGSGMGTGASSRF